MSALAALWSSSPAASASARRLFGRFGRASLAPFRWYHRRLTQSPLMVKSLTSGTVIASADLLSQRLRRPPPPPSLSSATSPQSSDGRSESCENWWNVKQTLWMGLYGALFVAPFSHQWYHFLERKLPMPKSSSVMAKLYRVMQRVTLDQFVVSPVFASGLFLSRGLIAGEDIQTIWEKTRADFLRVIMAGAVIWPPAQMVNFFFVPLPYRVLFINLVGFGWSTYTSLVASKTFHCDPCHHERPCGRPHDPRIIPTFLPRYMWMHSHPYTGSTTAPPPYTVNSWKE